jgi:predicted O-methyltransferase YrrM
MEEIFGVRVFDNDPRMDDSIEPLIQLCKDFLSPNTVMAEIGCFRGVSTSVFAQYVKTVYAIDPWKYRPEYIDLPKDWLDAAEGLFDKVVERYPNIIKRKGLSVEMAPEFADESLDAVYIDADHREAPFKADLAAWTPKVRKGGYVMGHDYPMVGSLLPPVLVYPDQSWILPRI